MGPVAIAAILVTIDPSQDQALRAVLRARGDLELGETIGARIPAVLDTGDAVEAERALREIWDLPGVSFVDVVSVDFSEASELSPEPAPGS